MESERKKYYNSHKEDEYSRTKEYRLKNRDKVNKWKRESYYRHREEILKKQRIRYMLDRERRLPLMRLYHQNNRERLKRLNRESRENKKIRGMLYLGGKKCIECKNDKFPLCCYDFHHIRDKGNHDNTINTLLSMSWSDWDKIKKELDKCVILCANCHRIIHQKKK